MKVRFLVIISLGSLLLSCLKRNVKDTIDNGNYRYWQIKTIKALNNVYYDDLYYFDNEGKWTIFKGCKNAPFAQYIEFEEYDGGDDLLLKEWKIINDSIIEFDGHKCNVSI